MGTDQITPVVGSRSIIVGATGTGKTTLARVLLGHMAQEQPLLIIDPKGNFDWHEGTVITKYQKASDSVIIYRPSLKANVVSDVDQLLTDAYNAGDCCVYIDELYGCGKNLRYPESMLAVYTRGRERKLTVMACSQRPRKIPMECISETEYRYMFRTEVEEDKIRLASIMGQHVREKNVPEEDRLKEYHFWYSSVKSSPFNRRMLTVRI